MAAWEARRSPGISLCGEGTVYKVGGGSKRGWLFWERKEMTLDLGVLKGSKKEGLDLGDCKAIGGDENVKLKANDALKVWTEFLNIGWNEMGLPVAPFLKFGGWTSATKVP